MIVIFNDVFSTIKETKGKMIPVKDTSLSRKILLNEMHSAGYFLENNSDKTDKQIDYLVKKTKDGCKKSENELFDGYLVLIYKIASIFSNRDRYHLLEFSDFISEAYFAFVKAIKKYEKESGNFTSFLVFYLTGHFTSIISSNNRGVYIPTHRKDIDHWCFVYLGRPLLLKDGSEEAFLGKEYSTEYLYADSCDMLLVEDFWLDLNRILDTLTLREKDIVMLYFGILHKKKSLWEIADSFDLSITRIRQIKEKAIRRMKHTSKSTLLKKYRYENFFTNGYYLEKVDEYTEKIEKEKEEWRNEMKQRRKDVNSIFKKGSF